MKEVRFSDPDVKLFSYNRSRSKYQSPGKQLHIFPRTVEHRSSSLQHQPSPTWKPPQPSNEQPGLNLIDPRTAKFVSDAQNAVSMGKPIGRQSKLSAFLQMGKETALQRQLKQQRLPEMSVAGSNMNNVMQSQGITRLSNDIMTMNLEPLSNAEELISLNPMNRDIINNYNRVRVMFLLNFFISISLILFELTAIGIGCYFMNRCEMVDVFLIVSGAMHIMIVAVEWARAWIWGGSSNPVVPDTNVDHMQVFLTCVLTGLYAFGLVWYTIGFAWIPPVFLNYLRYNQTGNEVVKIVIAHRVYNKIIPPCNYKFYVFAISYQVVIGMLLLVRMSLCCMSAFCHGLCSKIMAGPDSEPFGDVTECALEAYLPPIRNPLYKWGFSSHQHSSGLGALYASDKFSIITPMPLYSSRHLNDFNSEEYVPPKL